MGHSDVSLHWQPESIAQLMSDNNIRTRGQLATRLDLHGISRVAVYRAFKGDWSGEATPALVNTLAREFGVALSQLLIEPFQREEEPA